MQNELVDSRLNRYPGQSSCGCPLKCVSMKWSTKQTAVDFFLHISLHAAPLVKAPLFSTLTEWIHNPTRKRKFSRCEASLSDVLFYPWCDRVAGAAWENVNTLSCLPWPKLACRHSLRFTLARFVSFNYLPTNRKTWNRVWTHAFCSLGLLQHIGKPS